MNTPKSGIIHLLAILGFLAASAAAAANRPNLVYILADDMGYGDVSCYDPFNEIASSKIQTPHIDRLASQGMLFTDAHSPSAVCTPTRYALLTGRYTWRTKLKSGVLGGYSTPLIDSERETVASMFKSHGYRTAIIGKWHLGMHLATTDFNPPNNIDGLGGTPTNVDWTGRITEGPTARGFDYFFGCTASWDMPPYAWIENDRFLEAEMVPATPRPGLPLSPRSVFGRGGAMAAGMKPEDALPVLTAKAVDYLRESAERHGGEPFFLYIPLTAPHTPVAPSEPFHGRSAAGAYGDFVIEVDWVVGQVMEALETYGFADNTLLIVTSDNGPESPMRQRKTEFGHFGAAHFLGSKRDNWEGGHRVPFIARWPGRIPAGSTSEQVICLTDLMATSAAILGYRLPDDAGEDSHNLLPALLGRDGGRQIREAIVHHSSAGQFAIRQGRWKLLLHPGSGGNDAYYRSQEEYARYFESPVQLYDLEADPGETNNLAQTNPEIVERLAAVMKRYVVEGRSTPGAKQANDTDNDWNQLHWMRR